MTAIVDARSALITLMLANTDVTAQVSTRVWGDEIPRDEIDLMPRKCVVFQASGGIIPTWMGGDLPLELQRYDVLCYGQTHAEADTVRRAVHGALKAIRRDRADTGVLIHWARPAGAAQTGRDADGDWPFKWVPWTVLSDERVAAFAGVFSTDFSADFS